MKSVANSLSGRLEEYRQLLAILNECYDAGHDVVAVSIATAIRVLVHDTASSTSLLRHLNKKDGKYLSTNLRKPEGPIRLGLVRRINVGVADGRGGEARYWPLCDIRYFPSPNERTWLLFEDWWAERVFDDNCHSLSRRDLVLAITNKDGGAHFDAEVETRYDRFRHSWSGGSSLVGRRSGISRGYDNIPTWAAVRQISYELLESLSQTAGPFIS